MSQSLVRLVALGAVLFVTACAQSAPVEEEYVVVEPVAAEPAYTKY